MGHDVIVVGAGAAGLRCAADLHAAGLDVVILDGRDRIGGRMATWTSPAGERVELGAQVVHPTPDSALAELITRQRLATTLQDPAARVVVIDGDERYPAAELTGSRWPPPWIIERALARTPDNGPKVATTLDALRPAARAIATAWLEQVYAVPPDELSVTHVGRTFRGRSVGPVAELADGFAAVASALATGLDIRLSTPVRTVHWSPTEPLVRLDCVGLDPVGLSARAAVITVPPNAIAGVRSGDGLRFDPALPAGHLAAGRALASADAVAVVLTLARPATDSLWCLLVDPPGGLWHVRAGSSTLLGVVKGSASDQARAHDWGNISSRFASLVLGEPQQVTDVHVHDWGLDPWAGGCFSTATPAAADHEAVWRSPLSPTLHLAGEACAALPERGLVQGALASGAVTAARLVRALRVADPHSTGPTTSRS